MAKRNKQPPVEALTVTGVLEHIRIRLKTLGGKTHGPQYSDEDKARASIVIRELVKLQTWIARHMDGSTDETGGEGEDEIEQLRRLA